MGECYSVASLTVCECPKIPSSTITTHTGAVIVSPKRLSYLQAGYKQLIDERPEAPRGKAAALTRYDETAGRFFRYIAILPRYPLKMLTKRLIAELNYDKIIAFST